jgi:flagellar hook protein FlgE
MSLYGAMITGISGLDANSQAMSIYSSNIANVNTVGYKDVQASFSTLLTSMFGNADYASVTATGQQNVVQQGLLQSASSPLDLGISGNGFFAVSNSPSAGGAQYYTRAGNFTPDSNGNLQNGSGYYLEGWAVGPDGTVQSGAPLAPINISNLSGKAEATGNITLQANLDSTSTTQTYNLGDMSGNPPTVTPQFSQTVNVYDSQGGTEPLTINYVKTGTNTWNYEVEYGGNASNITAPDSAFPNMLAAGQISFNSDGSFASATSDILGSGGSSGTNPGMAFTINYTNGLSTQPINVNLGTANSTNGITQFASPSVVTNSSVDGALFGNLTGVAVDSNGYVTANFSNGLSEKIYQVPLATFTNEDGLAAVNGDAYQASSQSGTANVNAPNTGASGSIQSSELESSTVDLATEFTNLITTQRAYSASARIVTTADQMLQTLEQLPSS